MLDLSDVNIVANMVALVEVDGGFMLDAYNISQGQFWFKTY